jgi:MerR family transcriptional regulator, thiopeptide resistance regulator
MSARKEWSIVEIARLVGTTSRTLRHYGNIGLLPPSRIGANGYRYYDQRCLLRLQRILLLRDMGLKLEDIRRILDAQEADVPGALEQHLAWLEGEQKRLSRQIAAVKTTVRKLKEGESLMPEDMLDGFDHTRHQDEVERRWGKAAYAKSDAWYRSLTDEQKRAFYAEAGAISTAFGEAKRDGLAADSDEVQAIARRHFEWLRSIPGTPGGGTTGPTKEYFVGLADMYVADPRFAANYDAHGEGTAELVRDAMRHYAEENL